MLEIILSEQAQQDLEAIYDYILKDEKNIAQNQIQLIFNSLENLRTFPQLGKDLSNYLSKPNTYRCISVNKKYLIFYRLENQSIKIVRVLTSEQDYLKILNLE